MGSPRKYGGGRCSHVLKTHNNSVDGNSFHFVVVCMCVTEQDACGACIGSNKECACRKAVDPGG